MRILYIITQGEGGGAQKYVLQLARHFGGSIAAGTEDGELFNNAARFGIATYPLKHLKRNISPWHDLQAIGEMYQLIKQLKPDIVHLNSSKAGFLGSFAGKLAACKVLFTAHGFRYNEPFGKAEKLIYKDLERIASFCRNYIIAVSEADRASAITFKIISPKKISVIHNGIGPINFLSRQSAGQNLMLPEHKFIFGTVAGFYKTKGVDVLIDAVSKLDKNILGKCFFTVLGDGPEFVNCKLKIENLKLQESIKLLGKVNRADECLKAFDCFILPSRKEGFPYTLLEAMQAGLPIIASDVGGNKEALDDAAIIIEPENPSSLANAITTILGSIAVRQTLSQKALDRSKVFTEEKMFEQTAEVYNKLISRN